MKENFKKWGWMTASAILGAFVCLVILRSFPRVQTFLLPNPVAQKSVPHGPRDLFQEMDDMFRDDFFAQETPGFSKPFDSLVMKNFGGGLQDFQQKEDDKYVYYELQIEDLKSTSLETKVEKGYLTVKGTLEKKESEDGMEKTMQSHFERTFPIPENVDAQKMEVTSENHKVILKFPKV